MSGGDAEGDEVNDKPLVLALDQATTTGVAYSNVGETPRLLSITFAKDKERSEVGIFEAATKWMAGIVSELRPDVVALEMPIPAMQKFGATQHQTVLIAYGLYGIFAGIARCKGARVLSAPIAEWRSHFLGRQRWKGPEAKARAVELCRLMKWSAPDHNAAEAAGIWAWACAQADPRFAPRVEPLFIQGAST